MGRAYVGTGQVAVYVLMHQPCTAVYFYVRKRRRGMDACMKEKEATAWWSLERATAAADRIRSLDRAIATAGGIQSLDLAPPREPLWYMPVPAHAPALPQAIPFDPLTHCVECRELKAAIWEPGWRSNKKRCDVGDGIAGKRCRHEFERCRSAKQRAKRKQAAGLPEREPGGFDAR